MYTAAATGAGGGAAAAAAAAATALHSRSYIAPQIAPSSVLLQKP